MGRSARPGARAGAALLLAAGVAVAASLNALAAGSANLYPSGASGSRANTEWRTNSYGAGVVARRTLLHAYAVEGEYLLMGSSAMGQGAADILVWNPGLVTGAPGNETIPATTSFSCSAQRTGSGVAAQGEITSRAEELAGPDTVPGGGVSNGYTPCSYQAPTSGIYSVAFVGPDGTAASTDGSVDADVALSAPGDFGSAQGSSIAAWDLTVRGSLTDPSTTRAGRVFSYALALFTGGNGRPVDITTYPVTGDGFRYEVDDEGMDPNGWVQYANEVGFLDPDGSPLYHDAVAANSGSPGQLTSIDGGVTFAAPEYPIFFEPPSDAALTALNIPLSATAPSVSAVSYAGSDTGHTSWHQSGGTFTFTSNVSGVYQIVISRDGTNFDPTNAQNSVLRGLADAGSNSITWDGKDNSGAYFPVGNDYAYQISMHAGEYHFPFIDVENDVPGGPVVTLLNPPAGVCPPLTGGCHGAFYDDRGYTTSTGVDVGTPGAVLCGNDPPSTAYSDPTTGFDTTTDQRSFGVPTGGNTNVPCTGSFGDAKGLDLWTYYPSPVSSGTLSIVPTADIAVTDSVNTPSPPVGTQVTFTVTATDNGPDDATGVALTDLLPAGLTYVSNTVTQGSYDSGSGVWTVGSVADTASATLMITATVEASGTLTDTATKTAEDQADPVSSNNQASAAVNAPWADLSVTLTQPATVTAGGPLDYVITVSNSPSSPVAAQSPITATDTLPASVTYTGFAGTGWSCTDAGRIVTCTHAGPLAPGQTLPSLTLDTVAPKTAGAVLGDSVIVSSSTYDPNLSNNDTTQSLQIPDPTPTTPTTGAGGLPVLLGGVLSAAGAALCGTARRRLRGGSPR